MLTYINNILPLPFTFSLGGCNNKQIPMPAGSLFLNLIMKISPMFTYEIKILHFTNNLLDFLFI